MENDKKIRNEAIKYLGLAEAGLSMDEIVQGEGEREQAALEKSTSFPRQINGKDGKLDNFSVLTELGFKVGEDIDDLFVSVELPSGWTKQRTNHYMHTNVVDDKGRVRAKIFYKPEIYDRGADASIVDISRVLRVHDSNCSPYFPDRCEEKANIISINDALMSTDGVPVISVASIFIPAKKEIAQRQYGLDESELDVLAKGGLRALSAVYARHSFTPTKINSNDPKSHTIGEFIIALARELYGDDQTESLYRNFIADKGNFSWPEKLGEAKLQDTNGTLCGFILQRLAIKMQVDFPEFSFRERDFEKLRSHPAVWSDNGAFYELFKRVRDITTETMREEFAIAEDASNFDRWHSLVEVQEGEDISSQLAAMTAKLREKFNQQFLESARQAVAAYYGGHPAIVDEMMRAFDRSTFTPTLLKAAP